MRDINEPAWYKSPFLAIDTETSDIQGHLIEVAVVLVAEDGSELKSLETLVQLSDGATISEGATRTHGITAEMLQESGIPLSEALVRVNELLLRAVELQIPVVMYNVPFDWTLLLAEAERAGTPLLFPGHCLVDPYVLFRSLSGRYSSLTLADACEYYQVQLDGAHRAKADAVATAQVLRAMAREPAVQQYSLQELYEWQQSAYQSSAYRYAQWARSKGASRSVSFGWPRTTHRLKTGGS